MTTPLDIPYGMKRVPHQLMMVLSVVDGKILLSESMMAYHKWIDWDKKYNTIEAVVMDVLRKKFNIAPIARVSLDRGRIGLVYDWEGLGDEDELSTAQKIWRWLRNGKD